MKVVIIEDEVLIAEELERMVSSHPQVEEVSAVLGSVQEALRYFKQSPLPDLFFSDIQLTDGLSFEIFDALNADVPVVFCTAFDAYALDAFKANGIDYLLKPFEEQDIARTLSKYQSLTATKSPDLHAIADLLAQAQNPTPKEIQSFLVEKGEDITPISVEDVAIIHHRNGLTYLHTFKGDTFPYHKTLEAIQTGLGQDFFRANRQTILHKKVVKQASRYFARKLKLTLSIPFEDEVIISKAMASSFLQWLEGR